MRHVLDVIRIRERCAAVLSQPRQSRLTLFGIAGLTVAAAAFGLAVPQPPAASPPTPPVAHLDATRVVRLPRQDLVPLLGRRVRGPGGGEIGRLAGILVDAWGEPRAAILDIGGFLGVGSRRVAIDWHALRIEPAGSAETLVAKLDPYQLKAAPTFKPSQRSIAILTAPGATSGDAGLSGGP